ncbi:MAG: DegV family protein [Dehalococcoidales bacterium]|nr:DegV family protein [Dehalococcoidales bacterium]
MADRVAIITDSVACLPMELVKKYDIEVVPIELNFGDKAYRDGLDISPNEFYQMLRQADKLPTTAAALPGSYLEAYHRASQRSNKILCITLSAKLSGMFNSAQLAMEKVDGALPNVLIKVMDCGTAAAAEGLVVLAAAKAAASGKNLIEIIDITMNVMKRVHLFVMVDTLNYLVKGGRVPQVAALASALLKIKPIITITDGEVHPVTNPRTVRGAMERILQLMRKEILPGQSLYGAVMHADAMDEAMLLKEQISAQFDCAELFITEFTPVMGAHTGPGVIGVAFYSGN